MLVITIIVRGLNLNDFNFDFNRYNNQNVVIIAAKDVAKANPLCSKYLTNTILKIIFMTTKKSYL